MALFLACSVSATPYLLSYDTLALAFAALLLLERGTLDATGRRMVQLVYWLPLIQVGLGNLHVPGPALIAPAFAVYALMRLRASEPAGDFAKMHHGPIGEHQRRPERDARTDIDAAEQRGHVVAAGVEPLDRRAAASSTRASPSVDSPTHVPIVDG